LRRWRGHNGRFDANAAARQPLPSAMLYKFKSKAAGDVIMMGPSGDQVLRILGREPAPQGIFDVDALAAAMLAIEQAVAADEAARAQAERDAAAEGQPLAPRDAVSLRQRAWPLLEMMKRARDAGQPIVWGV
jgi:hypothetical protein